jgi:hypothetical protein
MRLPLSVPLFVLVAVTTLPLSAQSPNGNINGLVSDPSSAAVAGAEVVAVNDVTGVQYTTKTNREGIYVLPSLPPGPYRLQVSKVGFKTLIKPDIVLNVQDAVSINFTLPVGAVFEILTIEGGAPLVNTESAAVSTVVDQSYVQNMPLNGRSFQDLILLTPGTLTQTPQISQSGATATGNGAQGEFSVNGQRPESNYYAVDGVSANVGAAAGANMTYGGGASGSVGAATALGTTQALVSVDDLQEFRVQSSTYSAEYGRNPGGQFAFETKSGTNQWHGTAYDYLRNGFFDAPDWFNDYFVRPEPTLRQNDFGGTFGGPVHLSKLYHPKDKTFFFVSYEGLRLAAPQAATANFVPDFCLRGAVGSCIGTNASAAGALQPVLNAFPLPSPNGIDDVENGIAQFIGSWTSPASLDSTSVRFDHIVSDKLRLFFRFSNTASDSSGRGTSQNLIGAPTVNQSSAYIMRTYTAALSSLFSSHLSNDFRLNYSSNETTKDQVIDPFGGSTPINLQELTGLGPGSNPLVELFYSGYQVFLQQRPQSGAQRQWNLIDAVSLALGHHQFKFGIDYRRLAPFSIQATPIAGFLYTDKASIVSNLANFVPEQAFAPAYPLYTNFSAFAQDEWKVSQRLTLSLGLRWEVNPAPDVTQGLKPYAVQGSSPDTLGLAPEGTPLWQTSWYNFAPRLGAAYVLRNSPNWETVLRGGGGVFFDTGQQLGSLGFNGPGFFASSTYFNASFPTLPGPIPSIVNPPSLADIGFAFDFAQHLQLPYTLQWNASIEQGLGKAQALTISYVGSHASRLLQENNIFPANNPNASEFFVVENGLTSDYDSLQIQFRRRVSLGLTTLVSYTWSHCIDYGSQDQFFGYQRGNCDFDVRHNFSAAFSYDIPNIERNGLVGTVLRHWGLDNRFTARTAFPITLRGNENIDPVTGQVMFSGLDLVSNQPLYLHSANCTTTLQALGGLAQGKECPGGRAINPNAFVLPPIDPNTGNTTRLGNAPRNFVRGFDAVQMDLALRRELPIYEKLKLQFRAEVFNLFNHPNFGAINAQFGQLTFGQPTGTLANSLGVLSPLYQQGGPRSMQFALKLVF